MVYTTPHRSTPHPTDAPSHPRPDRVVLTTPAYFDVAYVINPHMEGHLGSVQPAVAWQQWKALRAAYTALDVQVRVVDGAEGLPDMVFCANQTLPYYDSETDTAGVVLSRMHAPERRDEVPHYRAFFEDNGYAVHTLPSDVAGSFEGMGDALWHPGHAALWGGYGFRTDLGVYEALHDLIGVPVYALHLNDPDFYHLDTCLSVLDADTALYYPGAFDEDARAFLEHGFSTLIEVPEHEARDLFACNAHCPDGQHVLIQEGCTATESTLREAGFTPVPLDTSEFLKAGGSVFCMKLMVW
jgi:N-dimethylarginine dimethylaminohydrolase